MHKNSENCMLGDSDQIFQDLFKVSAAKET